MNRTDYDRIEAAIRYLARHRKRQPELAEVAAHIGGLSGPGRLHDHFVTVEAVTPGEYRSRGAGLTIRCGIGESPFGLCSSPGPRRCLPGRVCGRRGCFRREGGPPPGLGAGIAQR